MWLNFQKYNQKDKNLEKSEYQHLVEDLISLIEESKQNVVSYVNRSLTILFWHIGQRILNHRLQNQRAEYGKQIVVTVSRQLVERFGNNYEEKNEKQSFNNWTQTRKTLGSPDKEQEVTARAKKLDEFYKI